MNPISETQGGLDHKIEKQHLNTHVQASVKGETIAASIDVIQVEEDQNPVRYYFPRDAVDMTKLERSPTKVNCPLKGVAIFYHLKLEDKKLDDAVWTYETPNAEYHDLKDRLAFDNEKYQEIELTLRQQASVPKRQLKS